MVQRGLAFAIVDEADAVLIDEGVTPTPDTAGPMVEELLRYEAPLHVFTRFAYEDIDLPGGGVLPRGEEIALVLGALKTALPSPRQARPARSIG